MKTTISKTFQLEEPIDRVWACFSNPAEIVGCVPGAALTEKVDDENYKGKVSMKIGPVKVVFDGKVKIEKMDPATHTLVFKGEGADTKGKGSAQMTMESRLTEKNGGTEVHYNMEVSITGKLAQFGSRLINDVTDQVLGQFIDNLKNKLKAETPAPASPKVEEEKADRSVAPAGDQPPKSTVPPKEDQSLNALSLLWAVVKGFFRRLFGGS
ncbi:MAG TPA: carbon monoxide dehydrogenase [Bacteroidetes bacterium]|nr:carbon monoxide dehydrogenase [Bacteroidota bacterium]